MIHRFHLSTSQTEAFIPYMTDLQHFIHPELSSRITIIIIIIIIIIS
jgi:hypothetical protein